MGWQARPWALLARHFFGSFFDFGVLSDTGTESLKRLLLGVVAVFAAIGLLLVRIFVKKYAMIAESGDIERYRLALVTDHAFLIAVPMWMVAAAVALVGHALFPDETDYRVLMAQPVSRSAVFGGKVCALAMFVGLVIAATHAALSPLLLLTTINPLAETWFVAQILTFALVSVAASLSAALAVIALHGLLMLLAPRARLATASALVRSGLIFLLILSVPLINRLPGTGAAVATGAWWLALVPPFWFVAVQRLIVNAPQLLHPNLAALAGIAATGALLMTVAAYRILYTRFDRVVLRTHANVPPSRWRWPVGAWMAVRHPVRAAVLSFASATLRRSVLHEGIIAAFAAVALAVVLNAAMSQAGFWTPSRSAVRAQWHGLALWTPFVLMFIVTRAARTALSVPLEPRANWIFRTTEDAATRADAVGAGVAAVVAIGVVGPLLVLAPLQALVLGARTLDLAVVAAALGWLHVEWVLQDWRRIPFTCGYVPGKGFVPTMFLKGLVVFLGYTTAGSLLLRLCFLSPSIEPVVVGATAGAAVLLARQRRRQGAIVPLLFEDDLPTDLNVLRLGE